MSTLDFELRERFEVLRADYLRERISHELFEREVALLWREFDGQEALAPPLAPLQD